METSSYLIKEAAVALGKAKVDSPRLSARLIMALVLDCSQEKIFTYPDRVLSRENIIRFRSLVARRIQGEPLSYIAGQKEFYGLEFVVNENVLIPRPETEILVEMVINHYKSCRKPVFADIGTGSGAIAVTIAREITSCLGLACDISLQAIRIARVNALKHGVQNRICFFKSDLGMGIKPHSLDFIISNPPYLSKEEFAETSIEVSRYEPVQALVSPEGGLFHFRRLEKIAGFLLKKNGMLFLEIGKDQGTRVADIYSKWKDVAVHKDLADRDRVLSCINT